MIRAVVCYWWTYFKRLLIEENSSDRKAYSWLLKWLPQDSASSGSLLQKQNKKNKFLPHRVFFCFVFFYIFLVYVLQKCNQTSDEFEIIAWKQKARKCFKRNQEVCFFWLSMSKGCWAVKHRGFRSVYLSRGGGGEGRGGWCVCVQLPEQVHKEQRSGRRQKTEEERWMYSAVIHKVESTTKLLATV